MDKGFYLVISHEELLLVTNLTLLEKGKGKNLFVRNKPNGVGNTSLEETIAELELKNGTLNLIYKHFNSALLQAELEVDSKELSKTKRKILKFDIDKDGHIDEISCRYWSRWGDASCEIASTKLGEIRIFSCDRIGVLASSTDGMHDIVCDRVDVMRWDAEKAIYSRPEN